MSLKSKNGGKYYFATGSRVSVLRPDSSFWRRLWVVISAVPRYLITGGSAVAK